MFTEIIGYFFLHWFLLCISTGIAAYQRGFKWYIAILAVFASLLLSPFAVLVIIFAARRRN